MRGMPLARAEVIMRSYPARVAFSCLTVLAAAAPSVAGCSTSTDSERGREEGQSEFQSAPPLGQGGSENRAAPSGAGAESDSSFKAEATALKPQETDIYRVEGDRLYYLNSY